MDLDSTNGLYLNTKKISVSCPITHNDIIGLGCSGTAHLRFLLAPYARRPRADILPSRSSWTIGRRSDCDICLPFAPTVSGHHATLQAQNGKLRLIDKSSLNGTWVNGRPVGSTLLGPDDSIVIGTTELRFHLSASGALQVQQRQRAGKLRLGCSGLTCISGKGSFPILNNIDLLIKPGEFVGILGPSGAGKTTLLKSLSGQRPPNSGTVQLDDTSLYHAHAMFRDLLGYVSQDDVLYPELSVEVSLNAIARLRLPLDLNAGQRQDIVNRVLNILDLNRVRDLRIDRLSGGQRKRVSIGAELITRPSLLFLDEPVSGLDPGIAAKLMRHFKTMTRAGTTVIMTTHNLDALGLIDKIILLARGEMVFFGTPTEAMNFFSRETKHALSDPVDIFHALEGEVAEGPLPSPPRQDINRKAIAARYAEKYRNSRYYTHNAGNSSIPEQDYPVTRQQQDITISKKPSAIPFTRPAGKRPPPFSPAHWFCLSRRHIMIRLGAPRRIITYALIPVLLALVTLTLNIKGFPSRETSAIRKQAVMLQLRHGGPTVEVAVKKLLSPRGLQDPKPAWQIIHALRYQGAANLPVPIGVLLMGIMTAVFLGTVSGCLELSQERQIYQRERMAGMRIFDYLASKLPFCLTTTALQCLIFIGCCALHPTLGSLHFLPIYFTLVCVAWTSVAMGLFVSSLDPTPGRFSILLAVAAVLPQLILSGGLGPDFWGGMHAITRIPASLLPARWGLEMELTSIYSGTPETVLSWIPDCIELVIGFDYGSSVYYHGTSVLAVQTIVWLLLCAWLLKRRDPL
jgi:ABC-type multidrug transport system ATPase subunit/pSer/pThr/pTyr-binding forkhead associated (FHA) protein